jgi:hypothetical protein
MKNITLRVKAYFLGRLLKLAGIIFGFGSITFLTMCAKYGYIAEANGRISGKVTSAETGAVIKDIEISIKERAIIATTDTNGFFQINDLEPIEFIIEAKDIDSTQNGEFQNSVKTVLVSPNESKTCDFALNPK